jgi:GNAT superfamily N-acetyltransferase
MNYELVVFNHDEREAFRHSFATLSHTSDEAAQKRREWWCFDNPYGGAFAIIRADDDVAATCYLGGKRLLIGGQEVACFEIGETATSPAHQRKGLFMKIAEACVNYGQQKQGDIIYGTPNSQATPGWSKFGFRILSDDSSWLFVIPNPFFWLRFKIFPLSRFFNRGQVNEISASDYIERTKGFHRLNASNVAYLRWRLAESPSDYRYFSMIRDNDEFLCAIKAGVIGNYPLLIVGEHFLCGGKIPIKLAARLLRKVAFTCYDQRQFMGLYVHGARPSTASIILKLRGIIPHRHLPICAYGEAINDPDLNWFRYFQLSDCDIG